VLEALHVTAAMAAPQAYGDEPLGFEDFAGWIDAALEEGTYRPAAPIDASVVITPLERATLRPFAAAVLAGADEKRLGAPPAPWPLLGDALAAELGLPTAAAQRDRETLALAHLLRLPRVVLLRRRDDGGEPLAPSPLLERLELAALDAGRPGLLAARDPRLPAAVAPRPTERPAPVLAGRLPPRLSASAIEALRTCPYRFHALHGLRLREADELDDEVEKRDYGNWLHAVLHRFHDGREAPDTAEAEAGRLHAAAAAVRDEMHLDAGAFLPFEATFVAFVLRYIDWLHGRDAEGARWLEGERALEATPAEWGGATMHGRVDRIDRAPRAAGVDVQLLDYKTGNVDELKRKVANPLEDTQLAFYAALVGAQDEPGGTLGAAYLTLDERDRISVVDHKGLEGRGIADSARALVQGVGDELERIRAGAPLPPLGEGRACDWCEARGLCRRDHWQPEPAAAEADG
jgi:ATP-dependent helicase/nuclease subunit B